jgi:hypothetical protein
MLWIVEQFFRRTLKEAKISERGRGLTFDFKPVNTGEELLL